MPPFVIVPGHHGGMVSQMSELVVIFLLFFFSLPSCLISSLTLLSSLSLSSPSPSLPSTKSSTLAPSS